MKTIFFIALAGIVMGCATAQDDSSTDDVQPTHKHHRKPFSALIDNTQKKPDSVDQTCMDRCTNNNHVYDFCKSKCSY